VLRESPGGALNLSARRRQPSRMIGPASHPNWPQFMMAHPARPSANAKSADLVLCDRLGRAPSDPDKPADVKGRRRGWTAFPTVATRSSSDAGRAEARGGAKSELDAPMRQPADGGGNRSLAPRRPPRAVVGRMVESVSVLYGPARCRQGREPGRVIGPSRAAQAAIRAASAI